MRAARRAALAFLLAGALQRCAAESLNSGLSFTIDERHGGLRNNPNLIVFIVSLSMAVCACGMCAIGFGKWDWLRVLIKGEDPTEVDLLGPPPPEPQGGGGNWVVRPRMETPLDGDGASVGPDARSQRSGWGGSVAGTSEYGAGAAAVEEAAPPPDSSPEAAAAWLLRVRGRPLAAPPAGGTLSSAATPSETLSSRSAGSSLSEEASASALPSSDKRSASSRRSRRPQPAAAQPPLPPEVEEARAFVAFAQRRPFPASSAASGSSFWSRASGGSDDAPRGGFWARLRGGGSGGAQPQPPAEAPRESGERRQRSRSRRRDADGRRMPPDDSV